jgi:hypothetical protein
VRRLARYGTVPRAWHRNDPQAGVAVQDAAEQQVCDRAGGAEGVLGVRGRESEGRLTGGRAGGSPLHGNPCIGGVGAGNRAVLCDLTVRADPGCLDRLLLEVPDFGNLKLPRAGRCRLSAQRWIFTSPRG